MSYDVVVVGGGATGLSAAVTLARSLRSVVVVDAGEPRNAPAAGRTTCSAARGCLPSSCSPTAAARRRATAPRSGAAGRWPCDGTGRASRSRSPTGRCCRPAACCSPPAWSTSHGFEVRGRRIGVLSTGPMTAHQALLFRQLSDDVTVFPHSGPGLEPEAAEQLAALGVRVLDGPVARLVATGDRLAAVALADGRSVPVDAVVVAPRFVARSDLWAQLGGTLTENPMGAFVETGLGGRTAIPGVWAAGNAGDVSAMIGMSAAQGVLAGAALNADLVLADAQAAVAALV